MNAAKQWDTKITCKAARYSDTQPEIQQYFSASQKWGPDIRMTNLKGVRAESAVSGGSAGVDSAPDAQSVGAGPEVALSRRMQHDM